MSDFLNNIRRKDRQEIEREFLYDLLNNSVSCTIAIEKEGYPLIQVVFFAFDEPSNEIIFHFSKHGFGGQQITNIKRATISVYKYGRLFTAGKAVDFGCEYQSVIIYGSIRILDDESERLNSMQILLDKFFGHIPIESYEPFNSNQCNPIHVARIKIENWLGKEYVNPDYATSLFYPPNSPLI